MNLRRLVRLRVASGMATLLLIVAGSLLLFHNATGAPFADRGLELSDTDANATSSYTLFFSGRSTADIGSIRLQLCINDPYPNTPCTVPAGLNLAAASLISQTGMTGFSISSASTANQIILTRTPVMGSTVPSTYQLANVTNQSDPGPLYGRLQTYSSTDASGPSLDASGLAIYIGALPVSVQTYVPPYLLFCTGNAIQGQDCSTASGNYIDFGNFSASRTSTGQTQIVVATNAKYGFTVAAQGTTMTSGVNVIQALSSPDVSRMGVNQFGLNLRVNSSPNVGQDPQGLGLSAVVSSNYDRPDYFAFIPGQVLVSAAQPDMEKYTVTYITNVSASQPAGIYVSTLTYIALATF